MDRNRQPLHDLRVLLNSKAKNISTKNCNNDKLNKELVITIHNDKTTNECPAEVSRDLNPKGKVNGILSTPILRHNQIFNTKVTEYIENSQKVTSAYHQYLAASFSLEYANQNLQKSHLNTYKSIASNENHPGIEHSQIVYKNYDNILKTIHAEKSIINSTKASNYIPRYTKNKMDRQQDGRNAQNELSINSDITLLPNTSLTSKMQERIDEAIEAILYITSNNIVTQQNITNSDLKLISPMLRNMISDRIINVLTGHPVCSRSDIIERYLKRYPKERDVELLKLYKMDTYTGNKQNALNINSNIILLPNTAPTSRMQERMDEALEAILYIISNYIVTQQSIMKSDLKLFSPMMRNLISDRIINVLTGHHVRSRSDIIDRYLKRYPTETNIELFKLYKTRHSTLLYLIQTDNHKHFYRVNMMRLINTKMKKIMTVVENMFKNSKRQLLRLKKQTKSNDPNCTIQKSVYYDQYTNCLVEREFSRLLAKFKNEIVHMILQRETAHAVRLNVLQK